MSYSHPLNLDKEIEFIVAGGKSSKIKAYEGSYSSELVVDITAVESVFGISTPRYFEVEEEEEGEEEEKEEKKISAKEVKNGDFESGKCYFVVGDKPLENMEIEKGNKTGLCYDESMFNHDDPDGHPENSARLRQIILYLKECSVLDECVLLPCREASMEEITLCHNEVYYQKLEDEENRKPEDYLGDCYLVDGSFKAAVNSTGSVLRIVDEVCTGKLDNGFALCRPPGHHALVDESMGFCIFSNVAIAAKYALKNYPDTIKKVLILDWDYHHGNGTQDLRMNEKNIMFISVHNDTYPGTGDIFNVGKVGNTVNICFDHEYNDLDILESFHKIILPISESFSPDLVLVSAGFDAVRNDLLGDCELTPGIFAHLTNFAMKMTENKKKVVLALEGGYEVHQLKKSVYYCIKALRGYYDDGKEDLLPRVCNDSVNEEAIQVIRNVRKVQQKWWPCVEIKEEEEKKEKEEEEKGEDGDEKEESSENRNVDEGS